MKEAEFKAWLDARGIAENARNTRTYAVRTIDKNLAQLGLPDANLEAAHARDGLASVRAELQELIFDAKAGGTRFRILLPKSETPEKRLTSWRSWLGQYGQFLSGKPALPKSSWPELDEMRTNFLDRVPDFERFTLTDNLYEEVERSYKDVMIANVAAIIASADSDAAAGRRIYKALMPQSGPLLRWQTADAIEKKTPALADRFYEIIGRTARANGPIGSVINDAASSFARLREEGATVLTAGQCSGIAFSVAGFARPADAAPFKPTLAKEAAMTLIGDKIFDLKDVSPDQVQSWLTLLRRVFVVMRDEWRWEPRDLVDVQGFLWTALSDGWDEDEASMRAAEGEPLEPTVAVKTEAPAGATTNLILYGPPGTGKTFHTAVEAVRLCGEPVPTARPELMARYQALLEAGRIEFVTFHQSFSYEDFVEGLRPVQGVDETAGFHLQPEPGVFRRIAQRAEASQTRSVGGGEEQFVLVIDEINRANVSKVLGELITLLEPDKRIGCENELRLRLPYSREMFGVPANLHIVGTMNTADRSIALLDTALRRRFRFREIAPEPELLADAAARTGIPLPAFLRAINDRIEYLLDREHRIGHAFFINCASEEDVHRAMRDAVIPLLQEYFFEDWGRVAAVLGEGAKGGNFLQCREIKDPVGDGEPRRSWSVLPEFDRKAYVRCAAGQTTPAASNDDPLLDDEAAE